MPLKFISRRVLTTIALVTVAALLFTPKAAAQNTKEVSIAAASDLQFALPELEKAFSAQSHVSIRVTYGSSGNLSAQIVNGAPFDVLLSADESYPKMLAAKGAADGSSLTPYARGVLVLALIPRHQGSWTDALRDPQLGRITMANPKHAPYGRAAEAALRSAGLRDTVNSRIVFGENIAQTAQFLDSGNVHAAFLAMSLVKGSTLEQRADIKQLPLDSYPPLQQAAIVTNHGKSNPDAAAFVRFLSSDTARKILAARGFLPPASESAH